MKRLNYLHEEVKLTMLTLTAEFICGAKLCRFMHFQHLGQYKICQQANFASR